MRVCLVYEGLFPGRTRAARHVEAMARRLARKATPCSVITTQAPDHRDPEGIATLRMPRPSGRVDSRDAMRHVRRAVAHLEAEATEIVFAEGLTPLTALVVKAARRLGVPVIVRVLGDRDGLAHGFETAGAAGERALGRKIAALLEDATVVAATDGRCREHVSAYWKGEVRVIERCVDLETFHPEAVALAGRAEFARSTGVEGKLVLLHARETMRGGPPAELLPVLAALREREERAHLMVVGRLDAPETFLAEAERLGLAEAVSATGPLEGEALASAYLHARVLVVPPSSRATAGELLEAMAMGLPVACFAGTVRATDGLTNEGEAGLILPENAPEAAAAKILEVLEDEGRRRRMSESALAIARRRDLNLAIDQVEALCRELLPTDADRTASWEPSPTQESTMSNEDEVRPDEVFDEETPPVTDEGEEVETPAAEADEEGSDEASDAASASDAEPEEDPDEPRVETVQVLEHSTPSRRGRDRRGRERGKRRGRDGVEELGASSGIDVVDAPARRGDAPEPGLTLKELMPFLRPPRTISIFGASSGGGHARAAAAIAEAMKGLDRNLIVRHFDLLDLLDSQVRPNHVRELLEELASHPDLFGAPFETHEDGPPPLSAELDETLAAAPGPRLRELVVDKRPDFCVLTHWLPLPRLEKLHEEGKLGARVVAVVCDPAPHARWLSPVIKEYIVPTEEMRTWLQRRGVEASCIHLAGYPVSPAFANPVDRGQVLSGLGFESGRPLVLLRPGGIGETERVVAAVSRLLEEIPAANLVALVGKNERLQTELEALETGDSELKVFGFVDNIRELMGAADLLVTRPTPHTVMEALAAGLPTVLLRPAPGLEERLADRLIASHGSVKAQGEEELVDHVVEILGARRRLREMREALRALRQPEGALQVVDRLVRIVR